MEIHLLGQKTDPAVTLSQGALVVINPMTVMTHTDVEHMETQMLKYKTTKHIQTQLIVQPIQMLKMLELAFTKCLHYNNIHTNTYKVLPWSNRVEKRGRIGSVSVLTFSTAINLTKFINLFAMNQINQVISYFN